MKSGLDCRVRIRTGLPAGLPPLGQPSSTPWIGIRAYRNLTPFACARGAMALVDGRARRGLGFEAAKQCGGMLSPLGGELRFQSLQFLPCPIYLVLGLVFDLA